MLIVRLKGWEHLLVRYIRECSRADFRPGELDCALFFAGAVQAMTGIDFVPAFRGSYRSIDDGLAMLAQLGYNDHVEYAASILPEVPPLMARRGDGAVLADENGFPALGVVQGENIYHMTLVGVALRPITEATRAFRV